MEVDDRGIPTGYLVTDINRGQYEIDLQDFISNLAQRWDNIHGFHYVEDKYGNMVNSVTGELAEE
jgi:hypothetical protein